MFMEFLQYIWPANILARILVVGLIGLFGYWLVIVIQLRKKFKNMYQKIDDYKDVESLVKKDSKEMLSEAEQNLMFQIFCEEKGIDLSCPIAEHIKTIYEAGFTENRLDVGELLKHTTNTIFGKNHFLRGIMSSFIIIGLLGTLIGLADSLAKLPIGQLYSVQQANNSVNTALSHLLIELKGAFAPSICGVLFTVIGMGVFTSYLHFVCRPLKDYIDQLTLKVWIPKLFPATSQRLLETLKKSEDQMEKNYFAAENVAKFAKTIESEMGNFKDDIVTTNRSLESLANATSTIDDIVRDFSGGVEQITSFQGQIQNLYEQILEGSKHFQENTSKIIEDSRKIFEEHNTQTKTLFENELAYNATRQKLDEEIIATYKNMNETLPKRFKDVAATIQIELQNLQVPNQKAATLIEGTLDKVTKQTIEIIRTLQEVYRNKTGEVIEKLEQVYKATIKDTDERINKQLEKYFDKLIQNNQLQASTIEELLKGFNKFTIALSEMNQSTKNTDERVSKQFEKYFDKFAQTQLQTSAVSEMVKSLNKLTGILSEMDQSFKRKKHNDEKLSIGSSGEYPIQVKKTSLWDRIFSKKS